MAKEPISYRKMTTHFFSTNKLFQCQWIEFKGIEWLNESGSNTQLWLLIGENEKWRKKEIEVS